MAAVLSSDLTMTPLAAVAALLAIVLLGDSAALRVIPRLLNEGEVPGLSIVLIRDSRIAWHHDYGLANAQTGVPLTERNVFEAASLTKPVFAYAVLKLADSGVLSLDTPLAAVLPEPVADERMKRITARMVLEHTTGFQNEVMPGEELRVHFAPGERFSYSGAGFLYLQRYVEQVTGRKLPELMRELVFQPLAMSDTGYVWIPEYEDRKAFGHGAAGIPAPRRMPAQATVATLHTTPFDYARFVIAVMKGTGLKPSTVRAMLNGRSKIDEGCVTCLAGGTGRISRSLSWGLGWGLERTSRGTAFWHWGDNNGEFQNFVLGYPDGEGIVVFTNSGNGFSIMPEVVAAALRGPHPAFAWMGYDSYRSPARALLRDIMARGEAALAGGAAASPSERQINGLGYVLLQRKKPVEAIAVFQINTRRFPQSWNAFDSLGEAYAAAGDRVRAIENYQRSLDLNPKNANAAATLERLRISH